MSEPLTRVGANSTPLSDLPPAEATAPDRSSALVEALRAIRDMEPEPPEYELPAHEDCAECARWKDHPVQRGICDERYRQLDRRDQSYKDAYRAQQGRMRDIARRALDAYRDAEAVR